MTIPFNGAPGNLFPRIGKLGLLIKELGTYQAAQLTNQTNTTTGAVAQFDNESDIQAIIGSNYIANLGAPEPIGNTAQQVASAAFNRMVFRDNPQPGQSLTQGNINTSINEVIRQMKLAGATIRAQTVAAATEAFVGYGNGVMNVSVYRPFDGLMLENAFAESVQLMCQADSYSGGQPAGNENFFIGGDGSQNDVFAFNWPLGSGTSLNVQAIDGDSSNSAGNILTNSGFTDWTANVPNKFQLVVGTAGTNIIKEVGITYSGAASAKIVGDGSSTLVQIRQKFGDSTNGTGGTLSQQQQYSFCIWLRGDAVAPTSGVLTIDLVDQNFTVLQDAAGANCTFNLDLTTLTTVFTAYKGVFRTPVVMPTTVYIRYRLSTALGNGEVFYMDRSGLGLMGQLYAAGPFFAVHSGAVNFVQGDQGTCTITNSRGAAGTLNTFQTLLTRLLPTVLSTGFLFPSSSTPTIPDSLIG